MGQILLSLDVNAPQDRVFQIASDIPNVPEFQPAILKIEMLTDGPIGVGSRWRETRKVMGKEQALELMISEFDAPKTYVVTCESMGTLYSTRFVVESIGDRSRVSLLMDSKPGNLVARVMDGMIRGAMRKGLLDDLESIKRAAEKN